MSNAGIKRASRVFVLLYGVVLQSKMGSGKDFEMSPFEAARKLLSMEAQHLSLGAQSDLIFQDMDLVPLLIQENYLNHRPVIATNDQIRMQVQGSVRVDQGCCYIIVCTTCIFTHMHSYTQVRGLFYVQSYFCPATHR